MCACVRVGGRVKRSVLTPLRRRQLSVTPPHVSARLFPLIGRLKRAGLLRITKNGKIWHTETGVVSPRQNATAHIRGNLISSLQQCYHTVDRSKTHATHLSPALAPRRTNPSFPSSGGSSSSAADAANSASIEPSSDSSVSGGSSSLAPRSAPVTHRERRPFFKGVKYRG